MINAMIREDIMIIRNSIKQDQVNPPNPRKDIEVDKGDGEEMLVAKKN